MCYDLFFLNILLDSLLRERNILIKSKSLVYAPEIPYVNTAISAYNLGYKISVPAEGVASFNQKGHEWALAHLKSLGRRTTRLNRAKIIIKINIQGRYSTMAKTYFGIIIETLMVFYLRYHYGKSSNLEVIQEPEHNG